MTTLEEYTSIAGISAGSQEMGATVAEAIMRVGIDGSTTTENTKDLTDSIEFSEGLEHGIGFADPGFIKEVWHFCTGSKAE